MGRPDDANPLHASLASEVIRRQPKAQKKESSAEAPVTVDRKAILALNASQRQKWLSKALRQAVDGRLSAPQLYDVVSAAKFAEGIEEKVGRRMCHWLKEHLTLFTNRQQRHLQDSAAIFTKFKAPRSESEGETRQREPSEPRAEEAAAAETSEDMMSRIREFMRGKAHERDSGDGGDNSAAGLSKAERRAALSRAFLDSSDEPNASSAPSKEPTSKLNNGKKADPAEASAAPQASAATRSASAPRSRPGGSRSESRSRSRRRTRRAQSKSRSSGGSVGQKRGKQLSRSQSRSTSRGKRAGERRSRSRSRSGSGQRKAGAEKAAGSTSSRRRTYADSRAAKSSPPTASREHKEREGALPKRRKGRSASSSSSRRNADSRSRSSPARKRGRHKTEKNKVRGKDKDRR